MKKSILILMMIFSFIGCANSMDMDLEGKIAVKGSEPFSYLSIKDEKTSKNYKIENKESFDLMHQQNKVVKIKAELVKEAVGPGFPAVIKVLEVK
jgi:uncharacterized lipoprotein NlpE involved in copper resistance